MIAPPKMIWGNDQKRNDDVNDLGRFEEGGNQQTEHVAKKGDGKQHHGVGQHKSTNVQDGVRHQHESKAVHHRHGGHHGQLRMDKIVPFGLQKLFALEQGPVTQNLLCADTESQKEGNDDGDEEEWRHIFAGPERVFAVGKGKPHEPRQQHGKGWRLEEVDPEVLLVAPLGEDIS